jgi:hypothetical protein
MSFVQARTVACGVSINGTGSARMKLTQQSAASRAWLGELQSRRLLPGTGLSFFVFVPGASDFERRTHVDRANRHRQEFCRDIAPAVSA